MSDLPDSISPDELIAKVRREVWQRNTEKELPHRRFKQSQTDFAASRLQWESLQRQVELLQLPVVRTPGFLRRAPWAWFGWIGRLLARTEQWMLVPIRNSLAAQLQLNNVLLEWAKLASSQLNVAEQNLQCAEEALSDEAYRIMALQREFGRLNEQVKILRIATLSDPALPRAAVRPEAAKDAAIPEKSPPRPALFEDLLYQDFEDRFRGPYEAVQKCLAAYLPLLESLPPADADILDIGCGRGEWLALLADRGLKARGIDTNQAAVIRCRERGLSVECAEALDHLARLPESSVKLVSAFHVVEHLPYPALLRLLDEIRRVLVPGGMLLMETPNPCNVLVGACDFYRDMTHVRPIHPDTLLFLAEARGFDRVSGYFFEQTETEYRLLEMSQYRFVGLDSHVWVSRDYGVLARKAEADCA